MVGFLDLGVVLFVLAAGFALGALFGWNLYGSFGGGEPESFCEVVDLGAYRRQVAAEPGNAGKDAEPGE